MTATPSTRLGSRLGTAMIVAAWAFDCALPLAAIRVYQVIPERTRGRRFGGPSASVAAARQIRELGGGGWQVIRAVAVSNHPPQPI